jgi:hypothetical protein
VQLVSRLCAKLFEMVLGRKTLTAAQEGWGDLTAVDFRGDAELLHHWPPPNFDVKVHLDGTAHHLSTLLLKAHFYC